MYKQIWAKEDERKGKTMNGGHGSSVGGDKDKSRAVSFKALTRHVRGVAFFGSSEEFNQLVIRKKKKNPEKEEDDDICCLLTSF